MINQCELRDTQWDLSEYYPVSSSVPIGQNYNYRVTSSSSSNGKQIPTVNLELSEAASNDHMVKSHQSEYGKLLMNLHVHIHQLDTI